MGRKQAFDPANLLANSSGSRVSSIREFEGRLCSSACQVFRPLERIGSC